MSHPYEQGTRIRKIAKEEGDLHPIGKAGVILGHLVHPEHGIGYFIHWDGEPDTVLGFAVAWKIESIEPIN